LRKEYNIRKRKTKIQERKKMARYFANKFKKGYWDKKQKFIDAKAEIYAAIYRAVNSADFNFVAEIEKISSLMSELEKI